jgi:hypothetical protein
MDTIIHRAFREIELYTGESVRIDPEDYELVSEYSWHLTPQGYAGTKIKGRTVLMHRLVLPGHRRVDHKDRNRLNNQKYNLRPATGSQNGANRVASLAQPTKPKGVRFYRNGWEAFVRIDYTNIYLGRFSSYAQAARAYNTRATEAWGEFALLNPLSLEGAN